MKGVILKTALTVASVSTDVGSFLTEAVSWIGEVIAVVTSNPVLFIMVVAMPVAGFGIGALRRLIRL